MILAFDTYYYDSKAKTVCLCFGHWDAVEPLNVYSEILDGISEYIPGEFYRRELPCILSLLSNVDLKNVDVIIVDGYIYVDDEMKLGLGGHLYNSLLGKIPVIGVAKSNFKTVDRLKLTLFRGNSSTPLYISSIGLDINTACHNISLMHGSYRLPTLLKMLDTLTKIIA